MKSMTTATKGAQRKAGKGRTDPFGFFKRATADTFNFLVEEYSFEESSSGVYPPECAIKYQNQTTGVTITYEWGGVAWVDLSRVDDDERYSLDVLMLACQLDRSIDEFYPADGESPNEYIERVLRDYAQVLMSCGREILSGDFRIFPKLKKLSEDVLSQRNKEMFGSETGVT